MRDYRGGRQLDHAFDHAPARTQDVDGATPTPRATPEEQVRGRFTGAASALTSGISAAIDKLKAPAVEADGRAPVERRAEYDEACAAGTRALGRATKERERALRLAARHRLDASAMVAAFDGEVRQARVELDTARAATPPPPRYRRIPEENEIVSVLAMPRGPERSATLLQRCAQLAPAHKLTLQRRINGEDAEDPLARAFHDRSMVDARLRKDALGILAGTRRLAIDERRPRPPAGAAAAAPAGASTAAPLGAESSDDDETPSQPRRATEPGATESVATDAVVSDEAPQQLPPQIRGELEQATGRPLGHVTLHAGERGDATAKLHGARAVAIGSDIHMARGQLDVRAPEGRELLAHEVAHNVQADVHGGPPTPAAKRDENAPHATTDAAEAEADTFAAQFREHGAAARWTPLVAIGSGQAMRAPATATAKAAPTASATAPSAADPGRHTAAMYFADNQARFFAAIHARLASAALPPPHARLVWGPDGLRGIAFERALVSAYGTDMDLAYALRGLLQPVDPFELIDLHRDLSRGRPGERIDNQPAMGPVAWNPVVGQALALEIEACLRRSLPRMGLRYIAQADDYHGQVPPEMLVTSEPFDRVVARLLCDPAVARFVPHGKPDKRADTATAFKNGIRLVVYEWQGARDPRLWNWIRVTEPADPRPEEVAASVFTGRDGENHTEHAYALTAAPPYFRIPPDRARKFPAAAEHAPPEAEEDHSQASRSALALADSPLGDETARVQAGKPVARLDIAGLAHTFDRCDLQLKLAREQLSVWGFGHLVAPAQRWVDRHKDVVTAAPDKTLKVWAAIATAQSSILGDALGDLSEVVNLARTVPPEAPEARPFREVIEALAIAMGESHLAQTGEVQLAAARQKKATLPLTLLDRTIRVNHDAAQELTGTDRVPVNQADHIDPRTLAASTNRSLEGGSLALREKSLATGSIDAAEMETLTVAATEETLRARILTLYGKLNQLLDASDDATDGFFGHIGNARNADIWNLRTELVTLQPLAWNILETMRKEALPPHPVPQDPALARAAFAHARKQAVANAQAAFAKLTEDKKLHTLYQRALSSVSDAQRNTAYFKLAVEIAVMIGVSVAGSVAGALIGSLVRGAILADAAVDAAAFARVATVARVVGGAVNMATDAAVQAGAQTAMFGGNTKLTFVENVMTNLMTLGALRPFHALTGELGTLDRNATGLWKVASAGKVVIAEAGKLTVETLVGAGAAYVSARLLPGQPPPSDDVAISWAMQGASMAVGKFVHGRMGQLTDRWAQLAEQKVHLLKRARAQEAFARQVEHSGDTASALHLLEEHVRLLQDEHALLQDPAAVAHLGLDAKQVGALRAGNETALADTHSQSFEVMKLRFQGLEPLATNGLIWSGTRGQIEAAIAESGTAARNAREIATGRWTADIGGRQVTLVESEPSRTGEIGRAPHSKHGERPAAPHSQRTPSQSPIYSFEELGVDQNRIVGNPVSLEQGHDILRAVAAGDASALTKVGLSGTPRLPKTSSTEFGLGRTADGLVVVVCGEPHAVDWSKLPGVIPEAHTHPDLRTNDIRPTDHGNKVSIDALLQPTDVPLLNRELVFPSADDFIFTSQQGIDGHKVFTPFVVKDGFVMKAPVHAGPRLEFTIHKSIEIGVLPNGQHVHHAVLDGVVGNEPVLHTEIWIVQNTGDTSGHLHMVVPAGLVRTAHAESTGTRAVDGPHDRRTRTTASDPPPPVVRPTVEIPTKDLANLQQRVFDHVKTALAGIQDATPELGVRLTQAGRDAAEHVYREKRGANTAAAEARKYGGDAAKRAIKELALSEAETLARRRAKSAITDGTVFDLSKLPPDAKTQLDDFKAGRSGGVARRMTAALVGKDMVAMEAMLDGELTKGGGTKTPQPGPDPIDKTATQVQQVYQFDDGTLIRIKPRGDQFHPGAPMFSIEMKQVAPSDALRGQDGVAFKVNDQGQPVPKGTFEISNPYDRGRYQRQFKIFERAVLDESHQQAGTP